MSSPLVDTANPWGHHQKYKSSPNQRAMINGEASCLQMKAEDTESEGNLEASRETNSRWTDCERSISAKSVRGRRRTLEDRYLIIRDFPKNVSSDQTFCEIGWNKIGVLKNNRKFLELRASKFTRKLVRKCYISIVGQ